MICECRIELIYKNLISRDINHESVISSYYERRMSATTHCPINLNLYYICRNNHPESELLEVLSQGADPNLTVNGMSMVKICCLKRAYNLVYILVKAGAEVKGHVEAYSNDSLYLLHLACMKSDLEMMDKFLELGCDLNRKYMNSTLFHIACHQGDVRIVQKLVERGADLYSNNVQLEEPLHLVARGGSVPSLEYLLKEGANIDSIDVNGNTPLHVACKYKQIPIVESLVRNDALIDHCNILGETAADIAQKCECSQSREQMLSLLDVSIS